LRKLQVGINFPCKDYGWDFGSPVQNLAKKVPPHTSWKDTLSDDLKNLKKLGVFAVRWFILADGWNYGVMQNAPQLQSALVEPGTEAWFFDPPPLDKAFTDDFVLFLRKFAEAGMQLMPSLVDAPFFLPAELPITCTDGSDGDACRKQLKARTKGQTYASWLNDASVKGKLDPSKTSDPGYLKGGRSQILINSGRRDKFMGQVLVPLLKLSKPFQKTIFAWELINEPERCTNAAPVAVPNFVTLQNMCEFINEGTQRIKDASFKSTIGFQRLDTAQQWKQQAKAIGSDLRLDNISFPQFHYYPEDKTVKVGPLPKAASDSTVVGEFASKITMDWPGCASATSGACKLYDRLNCAEAQGYRYAFIWSVTGQSLALKGTDNATDMGDESQRQVRLFTAEQPCAVAATTQPATSTGTSTP
jgi:hypothetical protein